MVTHDERITTIEKINLRNSIERTTYEQKNFDKHFDEKFNNLSTLSYAGQQEELYFEIENFIKEIMKSTKKNIIFKINNQLNEVYDNQTEFIHKLAGQQVQNIMIAHKNKRIDKMKSYIDYFYAYKQIYMEILNGYKNLVMNGLLANIKDNLYDEYKSMNISYEQFLHKDRAIDEKLIFINKAFRSGIINHVMNVEISMFHDLFKNHYMIFNDDTLLKDAE